MSDSLIIQTKTFDLLEWLLPKAEKFPRAYRFTLTQRALNSALDLQDELIAAEMTRGRQRVAALQNADTHLARLRTYLRLIHKWQWLNDGQYQHVSHMILEIGRMLGGWKKATEKTGSGSG